MKEKILWKGRPSQWINLKSYVTDIVLFLLGIGALVLTSLFLTSNVILILSVVLCFFVAPACNILYKFIFVKTWKIEITDQRVIEEMGVFSKAIDEAELYRIKDIRLAQPFIFRLLGLSTIVMVSSDVSNPLVTIPCINSEDAKILREELRTSVEARRNEKGVREIDYH